MADFHPDRYTTLVVGDGRYGFMPHPVFPDEVDEVYALEGGEALIYQVQDLAVGDLFALKVAKPSFRGEHIARAVNALAPYAEIPGLYAANRVCLTRDLCPDLLESYPALEYAVLMPWVTGQSWAGFMHDRAASAAYTSQQALDLALALARVMWELEAHQFAHTDIAGSNIVIAPDRKQVELLDIEHLYTPAAPLPPWRSSGSPGYQHRYLDERGHWRPQGDRFAGAILLAEMLAWQDPRVRALTPEGADTLFQPEELQQVDMPRWQAVRDALWEICPATLHLFDQAWASTDLGECPELSAWALSLLAAREQQPPYA